MPRACCFGLLLLAAPWPVGAEPPAAAMPDAAQLEAMAARFAPVDITADASRLPANERQATRRCSSSCSRTRARSAARGCATS